MSSTAPHPALSHRDLPFPPVVATPPLFVIGCRVVSAVPQCCRALGGPFLMVVEVAVLLPGRRADFASRSSNRRGSSLVDSHFPSLVGLLLPGQSCWWCRGSPLECYRSAGGPSSSSGSGSSLGRRQSSESGSPTTSQSLLSPFAAGTGRGSSVVLCWWSVLACRWSLFIASSLPSFAPLSEGSIHYHILDSLLLVRLPSLPLSLVRYLAPPRFLRYATIH